VNRTGFVAGTIGCGTEVRQWMRQTEHDAGPVRLGPISKLDS
jgi:hypothetical protein